VFDCAFKAIEVGCKEFQVKAKKLGKTAVAVMTARMVFDEVNNVYARQYSSELIRGIEQAWTGAATTSVNTALLDEAYQAVHGAVGGMKAELDRAAKLVHL
jgi:hypothetical protein